MVWAPVPPVYQAMFTAPNIALESAMACRVFRGVRLGLIKEKGGNTTQDAAIHLTKRSGSASTNGHTFKSQDFKGPRVPVPVAVEITRTTESGDPFSSPGKKYEFKSVWADDESEAVADRV